MKILNLYAGIGGNRKLWGEEHDITAVEYKPEIAEVYQAFFPKDTVIVADAHEYLLEHFQEYDFIWSSPPCPTHSKARYGLGFHGGKVPAVYPDMRLYQEIILLRTHFTGKWCVENVISYYEPLIAPQTIGRHFYWSNLSIPTVRLEPSSVRITQSKRKEKGNFIDGSTVRGANVAEFEKKLGFDLSRFNIRNKSLLLRNCVEPEIGKHILDCAIKSPSLFEHNYQSQPTLSFLPQVPSPHLPT